MVGVADAVAGIVRKPIKIYKQGHPKQSTDTIQERPEGAESGTAPLAAVPSSTAILPQAGELVHFNEAPEPFSEEQAPHSTGIAMVVASAKSFGRAFVRIANGVLVEIPVAVTEGMRAVPELWSESRPPHAHVCDWRSGMEVGGSSFYQGVYGAATGIFVRTYHAKKLEGSTGVAKGLGQGAVGFATKTTAAVTGLVAYPAQGISRSIRSAVKSHARRKIMEARWDMGKWLVEHDQSWENDYRAILEDFDGLKGRKGGRR